MSAHLSSNVVHTDVRLGQSASTRVVVAAGIGVVGLIASFVLGARADDNWKNFLHAYHTAFIYFLSLSLGALFFVILQHLVKAGWSVVVRRLAELVAANIPLMVVLFAPIAYFSFTGNNGLFSWLKMDPNDHLLQGKAAWLNQNFFIIRCAIYFGVWSLLSIFFLKTSLKQDESSDPKLTIRMKTVSAPAMILFGVTVTFFAFDTMMSLDPKWVSTIYGVCFFAGSLVGFLSLLTVFALSLQKQGYLKKAITVEHYHDIGKLLFAFVFFWGYVTFSQYMLIWYANMPEETIFYKNRSTGGWFEISMLLLFGHFIIPFVGLISRYAKRVPSVLYFWAVVLLVMHYFDVFYQVKPNYSTESVSFGLIDLACLVGIGGLYAANLWRMASKVSLIPSGDPRLQESLAFHNI